MNSFTDSNEEYVNCISNCVINADQKDYELAQSYIPQLESMDVLGFGIVVVVDYYKNDYFFVSKRLKSLFGSQMPRIETTQEQWFRERVHPEDFGINSARIKGREYIEKLAYDKRKNFNLFHDIRMLNDDNKWFRLNIFDSVLEYDKKGAIWLVSRVCHLAPIQDIESPGRSVLYNMKTKEVIFSCTGKITKTCSISPREIEVLILISHGLSSKQIADKLFISLHTVHNHRASLLKKLRVNNAAQAVNKATKLQII